jgi:two-component system KDP operon response regulator KdpE
MMSVPHTPPIDEAAPAAATRPAVLLVEDELAMRRFVERTLVEQGFRVVTAETGRSALSLAASHNPEVVILDLGLPDMDGLEVTARLREWSSAPILVVSARGQQSDKVSALDAGANDFITKPFGVPELLARIRVWLRQAALTSAEAAASVKQIGDLRVDFARRIVTVADREVHLTRTEYQLLTLLVKNAGKVVTLRQILQTVWGPNHGEDAPYVRVYVGHLRRKIERDPAKPRYLLTEAGVGYRFKSE